MVTRVSVDVTFLESLKVFVALILVCTVLGPFTTGTVHAIGNVTYGSGAVLPENPIDSTGDASSTGILGSTNVYAVPINVSANGTIQSIGINWPNPHGGGMVQVSLYTSGLGKPANLITSSPSVAVDALPGWQDIPVSGYNVPSGAYWLAFEVSQPQHLYFSVGARSYYLKDYGPFDVVWSESSSQDGYSYNMRVTYTVAPAPGDFMIYTLSTSQTVGAGSTATYPINVYYFSTLNATVDFTVSFGCPRDVTCTISPNSINGSTIVTLSVPTLPVLTGTILVTVNASSKAPSLSHTVTVQLMIIPPLSFPVTVYGESTRVNVTVTWTGQGTVPVTLAGPGNSPILSESDAVVYDKVSNLGGSSTLTHIHRVIFTVTLPASSTQIWTAYVPTPVPKASLVTIETSKQLAIPTHTVVVTQAPDYTPIVIAIIVGLAVGALLMVRRRRDNLRQSQKADSSEEPSKSPPS